MPTSFNSPRSLNSPLSDVDPEIARVLEQELDRFALDGRPLRATLAVTMRA